MNVNVTALRHASRRTKNRVRQHGPRFKQRDRKVPLFPENRGVQWVLLETQGWHGWLPTDEVTVAEECAS